VFLTDAFYIDVNEGCGVQIFLNEFILKIAITVN
jgi:hypothetical protein